MTLFYPYIILDGYRYRTPAKQWRVSTLRPATARFTLQGDMEGTFGVGVFRRWEGQIVAPHGIGSPGDANGGTDGNIFTLRESLARTDAIPFIDHNGDEYYVVAQGPFGESTLINVWASDSNKYFVSVQLTASTKQE